MINFNIVLSSAKSKLKGYCTIVKLSTSAQAQTAHFPNHVGSTLEPGRVLNEVKAKYSAYVPNILDSNDYEVK